MYNNSVILILLMYIFYNDFVWILLMIKKLFIFYIKICLWAYFSPLFEFYFWFKINRRCFSDWDALARRLLNEYSCSGSKSLCIFSYTQPISSYPFVISISLFVYCCSDIMRLAMNILFRFTNLIISCFTIFAFIMFNYISYLWLFSINASCY